MARKRYITSNCSCEVPKNLFFVSCKSVDRSNKKQSRMWTETLSECEVSCIAIKEDGSTIRESFLTKDKSLVWEFIFSRLRPRESNWLFGFGMSPSLQLLGLTDLLESRKLIIHEKPGDFLIGKPLAEKKRPFRGMLIIEDKPIIVRARSMRGTLTIVDIANYIQKEPKDIALDLGLSSHDETDGTSLDKSDGHKMPSEIEIAEKFMAGMLAKWKAGKHGNWAYTAAGLAWNNWRHSFAPVVQQPGKRQKVNVALHGDEEVTKLERSAYHGGVISNYFVGYVSPMKSDFDDRPHSDDILYHLDCRSLFPFAMTNSLFPVSLIGTNENPSMDYLQDKARSFGVVAEVNIETKKVPFVVKNNDGLRYCLGRFSCSLCGDELARAIAENVIAKVHRMAVYQIAPIFKSFVEFWNRQRDQAKEKADKTQDLFSKMVMNSLYGKFAQLGSAWEDCPGVHLGQEYGYHTVLGSDGVTIDRYRVIAGDVQMAKDKVEGKSAFPAISAFVTANSREYMRRVMETLPARSVYYSHTDSLICNVEALLALKKQGLIGPAMGQFREIDEPTTSAQFWGPGDYEYGRKLVQTGRKANARNISSREFEQDEKLGFASVIAQGPINGVKVRRVRKKRLGENKPLVASDNGWTIPLAVDLPHLPQPKLLQLFS